MPRRSDEPLDAVVAAAVAGSTAAFEKLYARLSPAVASYLRWHGVDDVEGVANEVFTQVYRNLPTFEGDDSGFRSWVFTIAHHRMIDDRRRAGRRPQVDTEAQVDERSAVGDVETEAIASLGEDRVRSLLDKLSPDQRDVVLLRVIGDLSLEDVAAALNKRQGAIKALQHRALASLRRHLEREDGS